MENPACQLNISSNKLMELICNRDNMNAAYLHVSKNKGVPGIDNVTTGNFKKWLKLHKTNFINSLLNGTYSPQAVKGVYIPKPRNRGKRCIGILTVSDRIVQQAIFQIISPTIDQMFSHYSFGFRKNKGCLKAIKQARYFIETGNIYVADIDIEKFFDNIHHDQLMYRLSKIITDKRVLKIIRKFLQAGMWKYDTYLDKVKGIYQGAPLAPLLSNLLLHELDILLEKRGYKFCRYADDLKIYTKSLKSAERILLSIKKYLYIHMKLKCNTLKTKACLVRYSTFLGYKIDEKSRVTAINENISHLKYKIRKLTIRSRFKKLDIIIKDLNRVIVGWTSYFRFDYRKEVYKDLDAFLRRRIRANIIRRAIITRNGQKWIQSIGCSIGACDFSRINWRHKITQHLANKIITNKWFASNGLRSIYQTKEIYNKLNI